MGLWEFLRQWPRGRLVAGVAASILVHVVMAWAVLWGLAGDLAPQWKTKKGDTIIVELPKPEEAASPGVPAPPSPPAPRPAPASPPAPVASRPTPPRAAPQPPRAPEPPREERRVASAPRPVEPQPTPAPEPAPRAPEPAPSAPAPEPPPAAPKAVEPSPPSAPAPTAERSEPAERQVASVPPGGRPAPSLTDVRAALRQGAGGRGQGRGGIEGDPIPLDSVDARYSDYLEQIRRRIKEKWGYPCVRNSAGGCDHYDTSLVIHFGILKDGRVPFVDVVRRSDHAVYDEYAVNAIKLASPFPPVPPAIMATMRPGSTGMPLSVHFKYVLVESSLTNILR
jgi:TonB family protein